MFTNDFLLCFWRDWQAQGLFVDCCPIFSDRCLTKVYEKSVIKSCTCYGYLYKIILKVEKCMSTCSWMLLNH